MALFFCIRVAGLCAVRFAKASSLLFYCGFSGVDFLADFLKIFWVCEIFLKKKLSKNLEGIKKVRTFAPALGNQPARRDLQKG
jgi:hypothetical protein